MKRFPAEFEAMLSAKGRRLVAGRDADCGALQRAPFYGSTALLAPGLLAGTTKLLARTFTELLVEQGHRLPGAKSAEVSNGDFLPKVGRMLVVPHSNRTDTPQYLRAQEIGLLQMLNSESYHRFCQALAGEPLTRLSALQVFCSRPGDYSGPHTDHHPKSPEAREGYVDVHLTFCTPGVREQFIVYERDGYLDAMRSIAASGTVTAYRLPIWHYTTPLQGRRASDRRWLVLGTFFFPRNVSPAPA